MLIGQYQTKLDEKSRCPVPAKFRSQLTKNAVIARWYEGCLVLVSVEGWNALLDKLTAKSEILTNPVRDTDRFVMGSAFEIELDSQGRFVVPKLLRDYANLDEDIIFVGLGNRVEVWDAKIWQKKESEIAKNAENLVESIAKSSAYVNGK